MCKTRFDIMKGSGDGFNTPGKCLKVSDYGTGGFGWEGCKMEVRDIVGNTCTEYILFLTLNGFHAELVGWV